VEENLKTLEAPVQYLYKQKMIERTVSLDDLLLPVRKNNFESVNEQLLELGQLGLPKRKYFCGTDMYYPVLSDMLKPTPNRSLLTVLSD
jgi:hypothetical protein